MLQFGIIGCGKIAHRHARQINKVGRLSAVCDIVPEKAKSFGELYQAEHFASPDLFFANCGHLDLISICTPNGCHAAHSIAAMRAGCHVLCEKPMAISTSDAKNMIEVSRSTGKKLLVVKQNRFNPPVAAVKELLDQNKLGRIFSIQLNCFWNRDEPYYLNSWKGSKVLDGGTLYTQFSHFIDLLYWYFGEVEEVKGFMANCHHKGTIEFEDTTVVTVRFANGILGALHFTINSYLKNMEGSLTIFGEKGSIKIGGQYLNELEYQCMEDQPIDKLPLGNGPNHYGHYQGSMSNHDQVYKNIVEVLRKNGKIATTGEDGLKTVEIIEQIYAAIRT